MATLNAAGTTNRQGATAQYQIAGASGKSAYDSTKIVPAGAGANIKTASRPGTYKNPANAAGTGTGTGAVGADLLQSVVIQNATDPMVDGQLATNQADNFLASTTGRGLVPTVNAAQAASAGKSMSPEHE